MVPLIVNTSDPMSKVRVVTTKDYSTKTLKTLHTTGVLHVEESEELEPVDREAIEGERRKIGELLTGIERRRSIAGGGRGSYIYQAIQRS